MHCQCIQGYTPYEANDCKPCTENTFKPNVGNSLCMPCKTNDRKLDNTGSHSLRKGFARLGCTSGRAGALGTQKIGTSWEGVAGMSFQGELYLDLSSDFAVLSAHFTAEGLKGIENLGWEKFILQYHDFPGGFR
eukprot:760267-Hanusia_phi.AAC.10